MHNSIRGLLAFLVVLMSLAGVGCTQNRVTEGPAPGVRVRDERAPYAQVRLNTVAILDESLAKWDDVKKYSKLAVESTNSERTATGTLRAWALLRNRTDYDINLECRVQFFNVDEEPLEGPTAWKRLYLPPNGVATYSESSVGTEAIHYYYIEIREAR
ncbi:MAG: hypothetical protein WC712_13485 [Candidatus Brocadiia bacterium]